MDTSLPDVQVTSSSHILVAESAAGYLYSEIESLLDSVVFATEMIIEL